ncbi:DASH complex subunit spc19 [Hypoxylon texense]
MNCLQDANSPGVVLAWAAFTSGPSAAPNMDTSTSTETTASSTSTPSPTPTNPLQGLSMSDKITLGTALGIGLPATVAGINAAWYTYRARERKKKSAVLENDDEDAFIKESSGGNSGDSPGGSSKPFVQSQITTRLLSK